MIHSCTEIPDPHPDKSVRRFRIVASIDETHAGVVSQCTDLPKKDEVHPQDDSMMCSEIHGGPDNQAGNWFFVAKYKKKPS